MGAFNITRVTTEEEIVIVKYPLGQPNCGFPHTPKSMAKEANSILESDKGRDYEPVGQNWMDWFLGRHQDELQTQWRKTLDTTHCMCM